MSRGTMILLLVAFAAVWGWIIYILLTGGVRV